MSTTVTVTETICDGTYLMTLNHTAKTATFSRVSDYYRDLAVQRLSQGPSGASCAARQRPSESFTKVGQETIDGTSLRHLASRTPPIPLGDGSGGLRRRVRAVGPAWMP